MALKDRHKSVWRSRLVHHVAIGLVIALVRPFPLFKALQKDNPEAAEL